MRRVVQWSVFVVMALLSYAVLAGVCQSLTSLVFRGLNHEFDRQLPRFGGVLVASLALFLVAGRLLVWTLPLGGRAALYTVLTMGATSALVPVESMPYGFLVSAGIRCVLAGVACGLMVAGSRV